ncbi:MAG: SGNH/GDSL hydrolase family protein [Flavobacteriales bacterium]|nr:SGNH/GDSL hydrolase family protein [Flavobacteriales bacterium]
MQSSSKIKSFIIFLLLWAGVLALIFVSRVLNEASTAWERDTRFILLGAFVLLGLVLFLAKKYKEQIAFFYFFILFFTSVELLSRPILTRLLSNQEQGELHKLKKWSYPVNQRYVGHPFTQYNGNSSVKDGVKYNNLGFRGEDFTFEKAANVVRVAALGGSTTERGYPKLLEGYLNENKQTDSLKFEVYNFGLSGWTSAHSLTNFLLNVVDFQPDVVIIHHAWNDILVRNTEPKSFRNDYAHVYKTFEQATIYDRYLLRASMLYRYLKWVVNKRPSWAALETAMVIDQKAYINTEAFSNTEELYPFQRNIQSIIQNAQLRGMKVILSTQAHSTDSTIALYESVVHIDQCNDILREMVAKDSTYQLVDLDVLLTGKRNELFIDLGHMTEEGMQYKANRFGNAILENWTLPKSN